MMDMFSTSERRLSVVERLCTKVSRDFEGRESSASTRKHNTSCARLAGSGDELGAQVLLIVTVRPFGAAGRGRGA